MTRSRRFQPLLAVPLGVTALAILALEEKLAGAPAFERSAMQAQIAQCDAVADQRQAWAPVLPPDGKIHIATGMAPDGNSWPFKACDICAWRPGPPGVNPRDSHSRQHAFELGRTDHLIFITTPIRICGALCRSV